MTAPLLERLEPQEADKILRLMAQFANDPRPNKVDLGVGVYRTPEGTTPVMQAVTEAEARLLARQTTKGYVALEGDPAFHAALAELVLGQHRPQDRIAALATPGGTGAVRHGFELARRANPDVTVWMPDPTWPNHPAITAAIAVPARTYRYYDASTGGLDREGMLADLSAVPPGDIVLLHGCCHNPTGADLSAQDWSEIAALCIKTGAVPMIDLAYLGFGEGPQADVAGIRILMNVVPEMLVAVSGSKSFGLYRERVGLLLALCPSAGLRDVVAANMSWLNRLAYAFPPDHGARIVTEVLTDSGLRQIWADELDTMRLRIDAIRQELAVALHQQTGTHRFDFLASQKGMFSLIGATPEQVTRLRDAHALYVVGDGRINLAGLTQSHIPQVAKVLAAELV
jgi:aspartate/tyrosine/aromatic aminotransferase